MDRTARRIATVAFLGLTAIAISIPVAQGGMSSPLAAGRLGLQTALRFVSPEAPCPPGAPADAGGCRARIGKGAFPGLGSVTQTYPWYYRLGSPTCPTAEDGRPQPNIGRLVVVGKGEIQFALAEGKRCVDLESLRNEPQDFTITGGTGAYQGASGSGTLDHNAAGGVGTDTWTGTLVVPGLEFDTTPPTLSGARPKTVRAAKGAKHALVTYTVTGTDTNDGKVPTACAPRSGSQFRIGRTRVSCTATDSSANTASASLTNTVKPPR